MSQNKAVMDWLLERSQPSIRYLTLTQLLGRRRSDPEVRSAKDIISKVGWAADILEKQKPGGWWLEEENLYRPKYLSTNWILLTLSDLGVTKTDPRIRKACELWIKRFAKRDGGFSTDNSSRSELCLVGNTARALIKFGYEDHPKVKSAFRWLVKNQKENGGWHCWASNGSIDAWEGMSAFAAYPKQKWNRSMKQAVERGAEFYLERELHRQGGRYEPWYRFHYPVHYYYDLLVGLDFMTDLGYGDEKRLGYAASLLRQKRRPDGKWNLDAAHPDVAGNMVEWLRKHPNRAPVPFTLEKVGEPSKMITLRAMRVLKALEEAT